MIEINEGEGFQESGLLNPLDAIKQFDNMKYQRSLFE